MRYSVLADVQEIGALMMISPAPCDWLPGPLADDAVVISVTLAEPRFAPMVAAAAESMVSVTGSSSQSPVRP